MSLASRISAFVTRNDRKRAATPAIGFEPSSSVFFGTGAANQPATEILLAESQGVAETAARAIANRLASLVLEVATEQRDANGTTIDEVLDDHALAMLLARPHPNLSMRQIMRLTGQWLVTCGEAYWLKVGSGFGVPVELHPMPPARVTPLIRTGIVTGYRVLDGNGKEEVLPADVVVRFFFPDPENPWHAEGYLGPTGIAADAHKFASQHLRRHFQHDATPKTALEAQEGAERFTDSQAQQFKQLWRTRYDSRNGSEVGTPAIIPTFYKLVQIAMQNGADIVPLLEYWRDDLLMAYNCPRSVLGQVVSGDRSSAEVNQWAFDTYAIQPVALLISDTLTYQLAGDFDDSLKVRFQPFISPDKEFDLEREAHDLEHGVRTINRVLTDRQDDEVEWGDKPTVKTNIKPYDPSEKPQPMAAGGKPPPDDDGGDDEDDPERIARDLHAKVRRLAKRARAAA